MLRLVRATLVLAVLLFVPVVISQFEAPKAMVVRVAGVGALAYAAFEAARRWRAGEPRPSFQLLDGAMALWLAAEIACTAASVSPRISVLGDEPQHEGLLTSLGLAGIYVATRWATAGAAGAERARRVFDTALAALALAGAYAVAQFMKWDPLPWLRTANYGVPGDVAYVRPFGTLGHPDVLGLATAAALCASVALALTQRRPLVYAALAAMFEVVTLMTLSRAAWLASLAGLAMLAVAAMVAGAGSERRRLIGMGALVVGVAALWIVFGPTSGMIHERAFTLLAPDAHRPDARREIWPAAVRMWLARPWTGQGPDTFGLVFPRFQTPQSWLVEWGTTYVHAHNVLLNQLATRGALGGVVGLAWAIAAWVTAWRGLRRPPPARTIAMTGAATLLTLSVGGMFGSLGAASSAFAAALTALLASAAGAPREITSGTGGDPPASSIARRARPPRAPRIGAPARGAILVATWVGAWCLVDLAASRAHVDALTWLGEDATRAVRSVRVAMALDPIDDMTYHHACDELLRASLVSGDPGPLVDEAEHAARRGIALEPLRALGYQELGTVLLRRADLGDTSAVAAATRAYDESIRLAPMNALAMLEAASGLLGLGRADRASPYVERAARLYPGQPLVREIRARVVAAARPAPPGP